MSATGGQSAAAGWGRWLGPLAAITVAFIFYIVQGGLSPAARVAAVGSCMAVWWMSEALPLAATALFPLALFPLLGVASTKQVASAYAAPAIFLFMGGFMLARVIEDSGLHRRMALALLRRVGTQPRRLLLGFMLASALLSMWISNTATTLVLLPVVLAVAGAVDEDGGGIASALLLGCAYGASIGGVATPVGSPPNVIFLAQLAELPGAPSVSFVQWMMLGLPFVVLLLPLAWWWLARGLPAGGGEEGERRRAVEAQLTQHGGAFDRDQFVCALLFAAAALAWITRGELRIGAWHCAGWASLFGGGAMIHDAVVAIAVACLAFVLPSAQRPGQRLLTWDSARQISWGLLILFGGGIALARGFRSSGLSAMLGGLFESASGAPLVVLALLITLGIIFLTEITSNTATATVMLPILAAVALAVGRPPLQIMWPATVAASCAFMLPVATPPNAVVFASGRITVGDMMRAGLFLNLVATVIITLLAWGVAPLIFSR